MTHGGVILLLLVSMTNLSVWWTNTVNTHWISMVHKCLYVSNFSSRWNYFSLCSVSFVLFRGIYYITPIIIHCLESWWRLWLGNLDVLSWFTNGMAGRAEMDRGRCLRAKCKSLPKPTWNHHEPGQNSVENVFQRFYYGFKVLTQQKNIQGLETVILDIKY